MHKAVDFDGTDGLHDSPLEQTGFKLLVPLAKTREGDQRAGAREKRHPFFIRDLRLGFLALHQRDHLTAEPRCFQRKTRRFLGRSVG